MVRSVAVTEPRWSRMDVARLMVSRQSDSERDENGFLWSEVTDPSNEGAFTGQKLPKVNWATKAKLDAQEAYYKEHDTDKVKVNRHGHIWGVTKKA